MKKKKNIKIITLLQFILILLMYVVTGCMCMGMSNVINCFGNLIDFPSFISFFFFIIVGLVISGSWKDFWKVFSVGSKTYTLKELKNIGEAVKVCQKLILYGGLFTSLIGIYAIFQYLDEPSTIGPNLAVAVLSIVYMAVFEILLLPASVNLQREINEVMAFDEMD